METHKFLRRKAASAYLHETYGLERAPSTLAKLAVIGGGPVFRRINRVPLYSIDDLDKWVATKLSRPMRSTSDGAAFSYETSDMQSGAMTDHADQGRRNASVKHLDLSARGDIE